VFVASAFRQLQRPALQETIPSSRAEASRRPAGDKQTSWGLSAQSSGFEPPAKHARRRSMLIHGSEPPANNLVANAQYRDGGEHDQTTSSGADAQYATDSRPWWSSEAPASAPVLGTFDAPPRDPSADSATLPLHKQHAELLYSIAQEEARCAELRGQLAVREARLAGLKQRWEDRRAERWGDRAAIAEKEVEALDSSKMLDVEGNGPQVEDVDDEEGDGKDRESILEETMRKLEGRKVNIDKGNGDGGEAQVAATSDNTPASSSSTSPRSSSISTAPITDPASPASSSTASLSSSSSSFGGIREARRWWSSARICTRRRQTLSPSPEMHCCPEQLRPAATPGLNAIRQRAVRAASYLHCERALRLRIWTPSEMTIFAPEEEWVWAWYFVGR
ncbi:hypothetical protein EV122DRAFT_207639, partial [Schizophyllum commune]